jgi:hypothetical protein
MQLSNPCYRASGAVLLSMPPSQYTDKKENHIFLIYKVNQQLQIKSNSLLIYGEIFVHFLIY